jgi:hypothetical protein
MAAVAAQHRPDRAEQLKQLRRRMAEVSGKVGPSRRGQGSAADLLPASETTLPVPQLLAETLPAGLPRGTVAVLSGARSLSLSMVAALTAAGGNAAIVGRPDAGLLAAAEMGADLSRIAVISDPGLDPVEVAAVLTDGMDLVVLSLGAGTVSPARARVVAARARHQGCTLLVADGDWPGAGLRLDARVCGYDTAIGAVPGYGRMSKVRLEVCAHRQVIGARTG